MTNAGGQAYFALRLQVWSEDSWAVVSRSTGAIALDEGKRLMMRLTADHARMLADALSIEASGRDLDDADRPVLTH